MLYDPYKFPIQNIIGLPEGLSEKADLSVIADEFDSTATYAVDDYVIYEGVLYKCTTAHSGAWDATDFTATLVSDEFGSGGGGGVADLSAVAPTFSDSTVYAVGNYVTYEGKLYKCTTAHAAGAWNPSHFTETSVDASFMAKGRDYVTAGNTSNSTIGANATVEGSGNTATGQYAHAEGNGTHANALTAHAEGSYATASERQSHAEGLSSNASGIASHAENEGSTASNRASHAEGYYTTASHISSHSEGYYTKTGNAYQHVQGKYNEGKATTAFEIGKGTSNSARSNALEVDWSGNVLASGTITDGTGNVLSNKLNASDSASSVGHNLYIDLNQHSVGFNGYSEHTFRVLCIYAEISANNWSATVDSDGYYTNTVTLSQAFSTYTMLFISCCGALGATDDPTSAQKAAYSLVDKFVFPDNLTSTKEMTVKAKTKPTDTFYVLVNGHKLT